MKQSLLFFVFIFLLVGCSDDYLPPIKISDFKNDISVKNLGMRLIDLPYGLNSMEPSRDEVQEIFIVVHGGNSEGYEWIYPLKKINTEFRHMYFYRWPDSNCFQNSAENLKNEITEILNQDDSIKKMNSKQKNIKLEIALKKNLKKRKLFQKKNNKKNK